MSHLAAAAAAPFVRVAPDPTPLRANGARVNGWLSQFDAIGRTPGGINRVAYSDADLAGRKFTLDLFREAGLEPRIDAAGNILGRLEGTSRSLPPILIGSHVDSVTDGGNFDGPVGSFSAIEVARSLREQNVRLRHPLEVVVFQNEEGGTVGSKLMIGALPEADLDKVARSGKTLREGIGLLGGNGRAAREAVRKSGNLLCYIELHIEQGGRWSRPGSRSAWSRASSAPLDGSHGRGLRQPRRHHADGPAPGRDARRGEIHGGGQRRDPRGAGPAGGDRGTRGRLTQHHAT